LPVASYGLSSTSDTDLNSINLNKKSVSEIGGKTRNSQQATRN